MYIHMYIHICTDVHIPAYMYCAGSSNSEVNSLGSWQCRGACHPQKPGRREPRNPAASDPHPKLCQRLCKDNGIVYQWLSVYPKFGAIHCYTILDVWGQYIFAIHIARTCAILDIKWP